MKYALNSEKADAGIQQIRGLIQTYFQENGLTYAIFGKSEGLDSSVIAGLLSDIEGVRPIGMILPCESDPESERIGKLVLNHYNIPYIRVELTSAFHTIMGEFYQTDGIHGQLASVINGYGDRECISRIALRKQRAAGNIKARLRMISLYHVAQLTGGVVVSTDNLSELFMGFWTLNGDVGDLAPIQHVFKGIEEYEIAKELGVPDESLNAIPTDGLDVVPGGVDEDQLGLPYEELDQVIIGLLQHDFDNIAANPVATEQICSDLSQTLELPEDKIIHIANQMKRTRYKRNWPKTFTRDEIGLINPADIEIGI